MTSTPRFLSRPDLSLMEEARPRLHSVDSSLASDALRRLHDLTLEMQASLDRRRSRRSSVPERRSPDGREAGAEEEARLPPPLPTALRPLEKMTPRAGMAAVSVRRQQLRRRRQRNLTAAAAVGGETGGQMRNSVSFCGIHTGEEPAVSPVFLEPTSPAHKSDSLVDVLHRRYYSHQYIAHSRAQPVFHIASLDHANSFLQPQTLRLPRRHGIMNDCKPAFPKSKSMNDASLQHGFSADVVEACRWLIEAGFPQYSQMFEDGCFPLDLETIREDHRFMDEDAISALFRRIDTLNDFVASQTLRKTDSDSVDGDFLLNKMGRAAFDSTDAGADVALSRNWQFERDTRRWSRLDDSPPPSNGHSLSRSRSRAVKHSGTPGEETQGRSLLRSASLRLRTAVSRFRRGDLNFRSLRRTKKPAAATVVVDEPLSTPPPPPPTISAPIPVKPLRAMANSDAMQILVNDTIDTAAGDKINVRTGSFMGKVGHRHEAFLRRRNDASAADAALRHESSTAAGDNAAELDRILQALYSDIDMLDEMMDQGRSPKMTNSSVSAPTSPRLLDVPSCDSCPSSPADVLAQFTEIDAYDLDAQITELKRLERRRRGDGPRGSLDRASSSRGPSSERENSLDSSAFRSATSTLRRNAPSRWSSVERTCRQSVYQQDQSMAGMSVKQLILLRKIALLKLTTIMEKHCPPHKSLFSWAIPKLLRRGRSHSDADSSHQLFGVSLATCLQRTGQLLPAAILNALAYLRNEGRTAHGIFRRAGGKARTLALRDTIDKKPDLSDFSNWQPYDVADLVKLYFRELPECLLTNKLSSTLINIFLYVPLEMRLEALQWAVLRLPDENRMVLQCLLCFLRDMAEHADVTQMPASNLAMCLAPTLFNFPHALPSGLSPKRLRRVTGSPDAKELAEQKAAHECLTVMIQFSHQLFLISEGILNQCQFDADEMGEAPALNLLAPAVAATGRDWQSWAGDRLGALLRDCRDKGRGWVSAHASGPVDMACKKVNDGLPLKLWRCSVDVEAPPEDLLHRVWSERARWDPLTLAEETVEVLGEDAEVVRRSLAALAPSHAARDSLLLRARQRGLEGGACALLSSSVSQETAPPSNPACVLQEDLLFDPCGAGKSRVHWLTRADLRGFSAEWYGASWGNLVAHFLLLLQRSFAKAIQTRETSL